jgi:hypothetical protein
MERLFDLRLLASPPQWSWRWWGIWCVSCAPFMIKMAIENKDYTNPIEKAGFSAFAVLFMPTLIYGLWYLSKRTRYLTLLLKNLRPRADIDIFISHSSKDAPLAEALINLLNVAIPQLVIRCTSVDGYRLPGGAPVEESLKTEVLTTKYFVGLITRQSMGSAYVLFELGARWVSGLPLTPLLAGGAGKETLQGPLIGVNALSCDNEAQLHQLIEEISLVLKRPKSQTAMYGKQLKMVAALSTMQNIPEPETTA